MTIRPAVESDIERIRSLIEPSPGLWHPDWRPGVLERAIRSAGGLAFVWLDDDRLVGFVCAHDVGWPGYLCTLVVAESAHADNVGAELIHSVQRELAARGFPTVISEFIGMRQTREPATPDLILLRRTRPQAECVS